MTNINIHRKIRTWHRYLGFVLGLQFLAWTIGGLYFSWVNIETIRGEDLRAEKKPLTIPANLSSFSKITDSLSSNGIQVMDLQIVNLLDKTYYLVKTNQGTEEFLLYDVITQQLRPKISEKDAVTIAKNSLRQPSKPQKIEYITSTHGHHEYREKPLPAYAITFDHPNNTTVYVSEKIGNVLSYRSNKWRFFDFLWMLHTMDYKERDNFNNWLLRIFSVFSVITVMSGFTLFFLSTNFKRLKK